MIYRSDRSTDQIDDLQIYNLDTIVCRYGMRAGFATAQVPTKETCHMHIMQVIRLPTR